MSKKKTIIIDVDTKEGQKNLSTLQKGVKGLGNAASGAKSGFTKITGATKMLGVAFKALGIGLIVSAFVKLKNIFSGNIETARQFEVISAKLGAIIQRKPKSNNDQGACSLLEPQPKLSPVIKIFADL